MDDTSIGKMNILAVAGFVIILGYFLANFVVLFAEFSNLTVATFPNAIRAIVLWFQNPVAPVVALIFSLIARMQIKRSGKSTGSMLVSATIIMSFVTIIFIFLTLSQLAALDVPFTLF